MEETRRFARRLAAQSVLDADGLDVRLHPGGELADEDALELDEHELQLIAQGPAHAPWLLLECPFAGLARAHAAARLPGAGARRCERAQGRAPDPDQPALSPARGHPAARCAAAQ